ncbi:aldehyde dehydrogenase domain-containing protein [Fusarium oxysporum]|nr:aldehyde dehydrogenase domain-containing protein [Fusarium oxysporum]
MASFNLSGLKRKDLLQQKGYVTGIRSSSLSGTTFEVRNPATLKTIATLPEMGAADTERAIEFAHETFESYKKTQARQRARWLRRWSDLCLENIDDLALILTLENGKTIAESRGEVAYGASFLEWFAGEAERTYGEVVPAANTSQRILTIKESIGVAAILVPWNFPIAMITRKVGAALAAGCTTVWKPAGETPLSALAQATLAQEAGVPAGAINVITTLTKVAEVGRVLCESRLVRKLSFTGSTNIGKLLARQCAGSLTKLSLELGGNSPFIVFDDAKLETAVEACIQARTRNAGQTCVSANRIFVQDGIYDRFTGALVNRLKELKVGLGTAEGVSIGPLTHERAVEKALNHIKDAESRGASVLLGGASFQPGGLPGYFIQPTILSDVSPESLCTHEETFAPIFALYRFKTEVEVLKNANACDVGLGSYVMTESVARMWRVAESLEVGMVAVNQGSMSACESPFGGLSLGIKESGYGREGGHHGIEEYLTVKSILINVAD